MKKKFLSLLLVICFMLPCAVVLTSCGENPPESSAIVYTVTESEWEVNFNITKSKTTQPQAQTLSCVVESSKTQSLFSAPTSLAEITSYTLRAEGWAEGGAEGEDKIDGLGILKIAPNGMEMEFYLDGQLSPGETGKTPSSDPWYVGMTMMLKSYFPFSGRYNDFTFDEAKKAYVATNLKSTVVDESDINQTYDLYNKKAEITFINGYLNTVTVEMCEDDTYENVYLSLTFTFSNINNTTVDI